MLQTEITNDCTCTVYDEETDDTQKDEYGYDARPEYCYGDCYLEAVSDLNDNLLPEWLTSKGMTSENYVILSSDNMNWNKVSGWAVARATGKAIVEALSINGDFILRFKLEDDKLTAVRSSHDELGAMFTFEVLPDEQVEKFRDYGYSIVE